MPYVSTSLPNGLIFMLSPISDIEESEVDEAECLGESIGEPMAVEGAEEASVSAVFDVMVRRRAGCCWGGTPVEVAAAIMKESE